MEWDGCQRMTGKRYEWAWNDGNEARMSVNECRMMRMTLEWDLFHGITGKWYEWVSNDENEAWMRPTKQNDCPMTKIKLLIKLWEW